MISAATITAIIGFVIFLLKRWLTGRDEDTKSQSVQEKKGQQEIRAILAKDQNEDEINALLDCKLRNINRLQNSTRDSDNP